MRSFSLRLVSRSIVAAIAAATTVPALATDATTSDQTKTIAKTIGKAKASLNASHVAPANDATHQTGLASFYSHRLRGRKTASGQLYDPAALTAAHRTLPLGTKLEVVNPKNDKSVVVTVNDRGPVPKNRVLDVSSAAADALGMKKAGVTRVRTRVIGKTDLSRSSSRTTKDSPTKTEASAEPASSEEAAATSEDRPR